MQQIRIKSSLVESDWCVPRLVRFVIGNSIPQRAASLAEDSRHDFHQLRGVLLISSLHNADLSSTSSLPVPDVLSQQDCLQTEKEEEERSLMLDAIFLFL